MWTVAHQYKGTNQRLLLGVARTPGRYRVPPAGRVWASSWRGQTVLISTHFFADNLWYLKNVKAPQTTLIQSHIQFAGHNMTWITIEELLLKQRMSKCYFWHFKRRHLWVNVCVCLPFDIIPQVTVKHRWGCEQTGLRQRNKQLARLMEDRDYVKINQDK